MKNAVNLQPSKLLDARVESLRRDLEAALVAVDVLPERLGSRLTGGLRNELSLALNELTAQLVKPLAAGDIYPGDAWARLHACQLQSAALTAHTLQLVSGAALRVGNSATTPAAMCVVADALGDEIVSRTTLGGWGSFTILGSDESYIHSSRAIVVPFPTQPIWTISIVAHELGHFAARSLTEFHHGTSHNLVDELHQRQAGAFPWYWVEELFADAFATWTIGPAYALTCVSFSFDPLLANIPSTTHPCNSLRVDLMSALLSRSINSDERSVATMIAGCWESLVSASEADPATSETETRATAQLVEACLTVLDRLPEASYSSQSEAGRLSFNLSAENLKLDTEIRDVINAAWLARLRAKNSIEIDEINRRAIRLAEVVATGGSP